MKLEQAQKILKFCAKSSKISPNNLPVLTSVRFELIEQNAKGAFWINKKGNPVIYLDLNYFDIPWVICHEWVHFLQWLRGDLTVKGNLLYYKNQDTSGLPYYSRPEEKEAREVGEDLWKKWNRINRG